MQPRHPHHRNGRALALSLAALISCAALAGGTGCARNEGSVNDTRDGMKRALEQMIRDSQSYYVPEGLPGRQAVLEQLQKQPAPAAKRDLSPLERFFLFEVAPEQAQKAPVDELRGAYCAAMESLMGDWWGTPRGTVDTATSERLLAIDGIDACLLKQLDNDKAIRFGDSEGATIGKRLGFQVADLAAALLARRHHLAYDVDGQPGERKPRRDALRQQIQQQTPPPAQR